MSKRMRRFTWNAIPRFRPYAYAISLQISPWMQPPSITAESMPLAIGDTVLRYDFYK